MNFNTLIILLTSLMFRTSITMISTHFKCRNSVYPRSSIQRVSVPDDKVSWTTEYTGYDPPRHTAQSVHGKPWADPEIEDTSFKPNWNNLDGSVNRESYTGKYEIVDGFPLNPVGRTGIKGRGVLGRWGPNHAADPVVTRWKFLKSGKLARDGNNLPILQFVAIKRGDTGEWALPGGMVDPGEKVAAAAVREFQEEAINSFNMTEDERKSWQDRFEKFFERGDEVFRGYGDDPRNTDNAWMETAAYNFHDEEGSVVGQLALHAGDDAVGVRWVDVTPDLQLYAGHKDIVNKVAKKHLKAKE